MQSYAGYNLEERVQFHRKREGIIHYIGKIEHKEEIWFGIEITKGKLENNDFTAHNNLYFRCGRNKGLFVQKKQITKRLPPLRKRRSSEPMFANKQKIKNRTGTSSKKRWSKPPKKLQQEMLKIKTATNKMYEVNEMKETALNININQSTTPNAMNSAAIDDEKISFLDLPSKKKKSSMKIPIYARVRKLMPWEPRKISLRWNQSTLEITADNKSNQYNFHEIFAPDKSNYDIYNTIGKPLVANVLQGFNAILVAYGQTGSGKTHTLIGKPQQDVKGILPLMLEELLLHESVTSLEISACEAYGNRQTAIYLYDLFNDKNLVKDWTKKYGSSSLKPKECIFQKITITSQCWEKINCAHGSSHYAPTGKNPESSRGHVAFCAKVKVYDKNSASTLTSYLVVVDLAGSEGDSAFTPEFLSKVDANSLAVRKQEAGCINTGLTQLQMIFKQLNSKKPPQSLGTGLEKILRSYITKKSIISVIFTLSPSVNNKDSTKATLKFAVAACKVKLKPIKQKAKTDFKSLVKDLKKHIAEKDQIIENLNDEKEELHDKILDLQAQVKRLNNSNEMSLPTPALVRQTSVMDATLKSRLESLEKYDDNGDGSYCVSNENWVAVNIKESEIDQVIETRNRDRKKDDMQMLIQINMRQFIEPEQVFMQLDEKINLEKEISEFTKNQLKNLIQKKLQYINEQKKHVDVARQHVYGNSKYEEKMSNDRFKSFNEIYDDDENLQQNNIRKKQYEQKLDDFPIYKKQIKLSRTYTKKAEEITIPVGEIAKAVLNTIATVYTGGLAVPSIFSQITDAVINASWSKSKENLKINEHLFLGDIGTYVFVEMNSCIKRSNKLGIKKSVKIVANTKIFYIEADNTAARKKLQKMSQDAANDAFEYISNNKEFKWAESTT